MSGGENKTRENLKRENLKRENFPIYGIVSLDIQLQHYLVSVKAPENFTDIVEVSFGPFPVDTISGDFSHCFLTKHASPAKQTSLFSYFLVPYLLLPQ